MKTSWTVALGLAVGLECLGCGDSPRPADAQGDAAPRGDVATDATEPTTEAGTTEAGVVCDGGASTVCGASCVDLSRDPANCGMCGRACPGDAQCVMGTCQPRCGLPGQRCCAGNVCEETGVCREGMCVVDRGPQPTGRDLVSAGGAMSSPSHVLLGTLGQSSQHQQPMTSTNFRLRGGVIGVIAGR